ncbi:MAG: hypothetical protein BRC25_03270 [Parcubacteria group bacterium SW_6_46_9]|nr:MAG: hypothetical protein BRC25_03270 [Parcubacteria group bacterium SW_6_46_9]
MDMSKRLPGWIGVFIVFCCLIVSLLAVLHAIQSRTDTLQISFLDVGQGDGTLIEVPGGKEVLVDGGKHGSIAGPLADELPFYDRSVDLVVGTHADSDHIGGLSNVFATYDAGKIIVPSRKAKSSVWKRFLNSTRKEKQTGAVVDTVSTGDVLKLGPQTYLLALFPPESAVPKDTNKSSLVFKLIHGKTSVMLTGDAPKSIERYLAGQFGQLLDADILKPGHHGSKTSSGWPFLSAVSPSQAVISAGKGNSYGHPHQGVLDRLEAINASTTCTCKGGTITFESDGKELTRIK